MKYLQALQRATSEREAVVDRVGPDIDDIDAESGSLPPILARHDLGIGGPTSSLRNGVGTVEMPVPHTETIPQLSDSIGAFRDDLSDVPEITIDPTLTDPHAVSVTDPRSVYCEEYRNLRTHLLRKSQMDALQTVVIASVGVGEGKSITALNLSWLLAQTESVRALLIDCDLRRPSLTGYFGLNLKGGLSDVLDGTSQLTESIVKLNPAGLYLLPGGRARTDVAELISGSRFPQVLEEARGIFDYVIIDAPPLGVFTDAAVLINQADGAIMVVAANQTNYKDVDRILESIPKERFLGVVLNKSDDSLIESGYYDYPHYSARTM